MHVSHKTKPIIHNYNMNGKILGNVDHHPYLGVEISKDLSWACHINQVANKANKMLGLLRRNILSCSGPVKEMAYKTLVRSKMEYCGAIWDPYHNNNKMTLEKVQRRAARFVLNNYQPKASVTGMLHDLQWETLEVRRTKLRLITIYKEVHNINPSNIQLQHSTNIRCTRRNTGPYVLTSPPFNKTCYQYSLYPRSIREWNMLPPNLRAAPDVKSFKEGLLKFDLQELVKKAHFKI